MTVSSLLPLQPVFLSRLAAARELAYPLFRGVHPRSSLSGPPTEFEGHRPYVPGDDIRWIDWNLFARLEELFVKVFRVEEEVEILLMVDTSRSMTVRNSRKYQVASAAAAALSYLAFLTSHSVSIVLYAEKALESKGPFRHIQAFPELTALLRSPGQGAGTDLKKSLFPFLLRRRRPVTIIVLSDGFQREPLEKVVNVVRNVGEQRMVLLRMLDPEDLRPSLRGNLRIEDIERDDGRTLLVDRALEQQLHRRIGSYFRDLESRLRQSGVDTYGLPVDMPFEDSFLNTLFAAVPANVKAAVS